MSESHDSIEWYRRMRRLRRFEMRAAELPGRESGYNRGRGGSTHLAGFGLGFGWRKPTQPKTGGPGT